jgi:sugar phosphate isomerase/epimerase
MSTEKFLKIITCLKEAKSVASAMTLPPDSRPSAQKLHLLPKCFKRRYPFRLATTSFIYPEDYVPNVRRLGPYVDEIELLFFESAPMPALDTIRELASLSRALDLGYNVHLPSDVSIGHGSPGRRELAVEALLRMFERVAPLSPSTLTLHVPCEVPDRPPERRRSWIEAVRCSLTELAAGIGDPAIISLENLDYPLEWLEDAITACGVSVCMDVGHLLNRGQDLGLFFRRFEARISIIHLHGADDGRDHLPLNRLPPPADETLRQLLAGFAGIVSLEVFSFEALTASLNWLENRIHA